MRLSASISRANPVNLPSSEAVQRTDPAKSEVRRGGRVSGILDILPYQLFPPYYLRFPHGFLCDGSHVTRWMLESP